MSVWPGDVSGAPHSGQALSGQDGELVCVRVQVEPRLLERLLETLAELPFPINPQIVHHATGTSESVEFPAYASWLAEIRKALGRANFPATAVQVRAMIEELHVH